MFYLIVAILIASFYFFIAPKSVKNTMNLLFVMATLALSYFTLKDFFAMSELNHEKAEHEDK